MESLLTILVLLTITITPCFQQRVAPGVPPQHYDPNLNQYQPPPPPQYQQQQQFQQQQPPQQQFQQQPQTGHHQQVPIQQHQQVPVQHQQPPVQHQQQIPQQQQQQQQHVVHVQQSGHGSHSHGHGNSIGGGQPILDAAQIVQERQHIQEHMDVPIDTSQMSEQELQFHYFKMHDADNNNKLDGCELVKSLIHWHAGDGNSDQSNHDTRSGQPIPEAKIFKDEELSMMIDPILQNDDKNRDGFIDYGEFVQAQAAASAKDDDTDSGPATITDSNLSAIVDQILDFDANEDGYIDYNEFKVAQNVGNKKRKEEEKCETCN